MLTSAGQPMAELFLEPNGRATMRDSSGVLWRAGFQLQDEKREFSLFREVQPPLFYTFAQPDTDHLVLTATGDSAAATGTLSLRRVPLPSRYPLLNEGFSPRERMAPRALSSHQKVSPSSAFRPSLERDVSRSSEKSSSCLPS